jgi:hypothetical protein
MKKIYASVFLLAAFCTLQAQLTQSNQAPFVGNGYLVYQCDSLGINPGTGGAGSNWVFSMATHSSTAAYYMSVAASNPSYPSAQIVVGPTPTNTGYYSASASSLLYYGGNRAVGQAVFSLGYTSPAVYAFYPMSLNSSTTSSTAGTINVTAPISASGNFTGNCTATLDGTGTLSIAGNTFNNVYRIMINEVVSFTTSFANGNVSQVSYEYYDPVAKAPLLTISNATATIPFGNFTQTLVTRLSYTAGSTVGIDEIKQAADLRVFPNPAINELRVASHDGDQKDLRLFDLTGNLVRSVNGAGDIRVDVSGLNSGLYLYSISVGDKIQKSGKVSIVH